MSQQTELQPTLGTKLRDLRKRRGMTQAQLASSAHISCSQIGRLESGECQPRSVTAVVLAAVLGDDGFDRDVLAHLEGLPRQADRPRNRRGRFS
jgi:transcriptional regulator with XRE-family HTH domain